jgi:hypothetical protein
MAHFKWERISSGLSITICEPIIQFSFLFLESINIFQNSKKFSNSSLSCDLADEPTGSNRKLGTLYLLHNDQPKSGGY